MRTLFDTANPSPSGEEIPMVSFGSNVIGKLLNGSRTPGDTRGLGFSSPITSSTNDDPYANYDNALAPGYTRSQRYGTVNEKYGNFVPGGWARPSGSSDTTNNYYDPFTPEGPDFSVGNSQGTQTTEPMNLNIEPPPASAKSVGSSATSGLYPTSAPASAYTSGVNPASLGSAGTAPQAMSAGGGGGADIASAIAKKVDDVGQAGMDIYDTMNKNKSDAQYRRDVTRPGMHSGLHAGLKQNYRDNVRANANAYSKLGNSLFGIPGSILGYMIGNRYHSDIKKPDLNTANSTSGKVNPQDNGIVHSMSTAAGKNTYGVPDNIYGKDGMDDDVGNSDGDLHANLGDGEQGVTLSSPMGPNRNPDPSRSISMSANGPGIPRSENTRADYLALQEMGLSGYWQNDTEFGNQALGDDALDAELQASVPNPQFTDDDLDSEGGDFAFDEGYNTLDWDNTM